MGSCKFLSERFGGNTGSWWIQQRGALRSRQHEDGGARHSAFVLVEARGILRCDPLTQRDMLRARDSQWHHAHLGI